MLALESPDHTEIGADNNVHYIKESNKLRSPINSALVPFV